MILVFTGNGKGKTTSAIGQGIRVLGQGGKVAMIQFIKSPKWPTGEEKALKKFGRKMKLIKGGKGFVGIMGDKLPRVVHKKAAQDAWQRAKAIIRSKKFDLVILDEINVAISLRLLSAAKAADFLSQLSKGIDVICTGRYSPKIFIQLADLVTEFREVKHPYKKGVQGKRGREY